MSIRPETMAGIAEQLLTRDQLASVGRGQLELDSQPRSPWVPGSMHGRPTAVRPRADPKLSVRIWDLAHPR